MILVQQKLKNASNQKTDAYDYWNSSIETSQGKLQQKKYDKLNEKMLQDYAIIGEHVAANKGENALDARREIARQACVSFAEMSILPKSPNPPKDSLGKVLGAVLVAGAIAAVPFTGGLSIGVAAAASGGAAAAGIGVSAGVGILAAGAIAGGTLMSADKGHAKVADATGFERDLVGSKQMNQWDYKETITSTFEWDTLKCEKCVRSQKMFQIQKTTVWQSLLRRLGRTNKPM